MRAGFKLGFEMLVRLGVISATCLLGLQGMRLHAQQKAQNCPWLNKATAAGLLGGEGSLNVTKTAMRTAELPNGAPADSTCEFDSPHGSSGTMLRIAVHTMQDHSTEYSAFTAECGSSARRLVGVGNEAVACTRKKGANTIEQVVGRVRQRVFILSWSLPVPSSPAGANDAKTADDKLQNIAEQIAGSLF